MSNALRILAVTYLLLTSASISAAEPREVLWEDLMPAGWIPPETSSQSQFLDESEPAAEQLSVDAPVVKELDNEYVKIPGFILPVEFSGDAVSEFLLVPYVGACIHVPPPPSNQIVYVRLKEPLAGTNLYDPVWVEGTMRVESTSSDYAQAAYTVEGNKISKYEW